MEHKITYLVFIIYTPICAHTWAYTVYNFFCVSIDIVCRINRQD